MRLLVGKLVQHVRDNCSVAGILLPLAASHPIHLHAIQQQRTTEPGVSNCSRSVVVAATDASAPFLPRCFRRARLTQMHMQRKRLPHCHAAGSQSRVESVYQQRHKLTSHDDARRRQLLRQRGSLRGCRVLVNGCCVLKSVTFCSCRPVPAPLAVRSLDDARAFFDKRCREAGCGFSWSECQRSIRTSIRVRFGRMGWRPCKKWLLLLLRCWA